MRVGSHPEMDDIETRKLTWTQLEVGNEIVTISRRSLIRRQLSRYPVCIRSGYVRGSKKVFGGKAIVAVGVVRRDWPLIDPEDVHAGPIEGGAR